MRQLHSEGQVMRELIDQFEAAEAWLTPMRPWGVYSHWLLAWRSHAGGRAKMDYVGVVASCFCFCSVWILMCVYVTSHEVGSEMSVGRISRRIWVGEDASEWSDDRLRCDMFPGWHGCRYNGRLAAFCDANVCHGYVPHMLPSSSSWT